MKDSDDRTSLHKCNSEQLWKIRENQILVNFSHDGFDAKIIFLSNAELSIHFPFLKIPENVHSHFPAQKKNCENQWSIVEMRAFPHVLS